jgi:hypothetical protein
MTKILKAYAVGRGPSDVGNGLLDCATVTIQTSPDNLRELSRFLVNCADRLEASTANDPSVHFHLQDEWKAWKSKYADFVVAAP